MAKNLVIVESPAKAKTINKILGKDFVVRSSMGHVRDLPAKRFGVDIKKGFQPTYSIVKGRKELVGELTKEAKGVSAIYLAPDPDREGEAIAWHLKCILERAAKKVRFYRVSYNEITPRAVQEAFKHPVELDMRRVWAQQARRVVDRIVGYKVSPLLWSKVKRGSSAGRVQSVALRLVCEREKLIAAFVPESYWVIGAVVRKLMAPLDPFEVMLAKIDGEKADVRREKDATAIVDDLEQRKLQVSSIVTREVTRKAPPPFITSTLQQAASSNFGLSPSRTMKIAQTLYEGIDIDGTTAGLITYMRTDSVAISQDALKECRKLISSEFGKPFLPAKPNTYKNRKGAQEAHEAIRPTDVTRTPESLARKLKPADLKLYRLIWQRFVASQMTPAKIQRQTIEVDALPASGEAGRTYLFRVTSSRVEFDGFMKVAGRPKKKEGEEKPIPPVTEGEPLQKLEWLNERKETQPPHRFSEASLVKELEQNGVGRPSTYAAILATLSQRRYVTRDNRTLMPTELGMKVNDFLTENLGELFDVGFTAIMEQSLDEIEAGKTEWDAMVSEFHGRFVVWMEKAKGPPADNEKVAWILGELDAVKEWIAPVKFGRRTYDDKKFAGSIREQLDAGKKPISMRQLSVLVTLACRYDHQLRGIRERVEEAGLRELIDERQSQPPADATIRKLEVLSKIEWAPPVERRGRKYDDGNFVGSLQSQVTAGRALSDAQRGSLDRLILKYGEQIPDLESIRESLGIELAKEHDPQTEALLKLTECIGEWRPPVMRGKREFDDKDFCESLSRQFAQKGALSPRQKGALGRLLARYAEQIPDYDKVAAEHGLKPKSEGKKKSPAPSTKPAGESEVADAASPDDERSG